jgi:hypothetical protein
VEWFGEGGVDRRALLNLGRIAAAGGGLLALATVTAGPAQATTVPTVPQPEVAPTPAPSGPPTAQPDPGTVPALSKADVGLSAVDNTADADKPVSAAQQAALDLKADETGIVRGTDGRRYRMVACAVRNSGLGFSLIDDDRHTPVGVLSTESALDDMSFTIRMGFDGLKVSSVVVVADETLSAAGYQLGASVGLNSITIQASQPAGLGDYVSWNGSAWVSLNGLVTSTTMNKTTGLITCTHAAMSSPYGGSVTSRSLTKRASMEGISATSTSLYLVDNAGMPVKTPTKDNRFWLTRTGARRVPMSELVIPSANIWVYGMFEA